MRIFKRAVILIAMAVLSMGCLFACKVKPREDSEIYSCYYYEANGEDLTSEIVNYTLELRTDGVLITRYKTKKNSDSGRDKYRIENGTMIITTYYGTKKYDMPGNELLISEMVDDYFLVIKFRLTQTMKEINADIYSCIKRISGEGTAVDFRYYVASFDSDGSFSIWYRDKEERLPVLSGTYTEFDWGYIATQTIDDESEARSWRFEYDDNDNLVLTETEDGITVTSTFKKTHDGLSSGD